MKVQWLSQSLSMPPHPTARLPTNPPSDLKSPDLRGHPKEAESNFTKMLGLLEDGILSMEDTNIISYHIISYHIIS